MLSKSFRKQLLLPGKLHAFPLSKLDATVSMLLPGLSLSRCEHLQISETETRPNWGRVMQELLLVNASVAENGSNLLSTNSKSLFLHQRPWKPPFLLIQCLKLVGTMDIPNCSRNVQKLKFTTLVQVLLCVFRLKKCSSEKVSFMVLIVLPFTHSWSAIIGTLSRQITGQWGWHLDPSVGCLSWVIRALWWILRFGRGRCCFGITYAVR